MLKYGGCAFLDDLFHLINLYWEVTSLLLSSPTTVANLLVSFLCEYASNLSSSWSVNYFPGLCLLTRLLFCPWSTMSSLTLEMWNLCHLCECVCCQLAWAPPGPSSSSFLGQAFTLTIWLCRLTPLCAWILSPTLQTFHIPVLGATWRSGRLHIKIKKICRRAEFRSHWLAHSGTVFCQW